MAWAEGVFETDNERESHRLNAAGLARHATIEAWVDWIIDKEAVE